MNYKTYPVADLIDEIAMGPFGSNIKVDSFVDEGVPVLNGSNLEGFELTEKSFRYVTEEKADSLKKANAHKGDVVITHRGTLGQIVYIPQTAKRIAMSYHNPNSVLSVMRMFYQSILFTIFTHR